MARFMGRIGSSEMVERELQMKVKELIKKLKEYDEELPVWFVDTQFVNCYYEIQRVYDFPIERTKIIPGKKIEYYSVDAVILDIE